MRKEIGEVRLRGFRVMRVDTGQTDKQTYSLQYFALLPGRSNKVTAGIRLRSWSGAARGEPLSVGLYALRVAYAWPLCANMTASTKPEVRNINRRRRRTEPQPEATNDRKFGEVWTSGF